MIDFNALLTDEEKKAIGVLEAGGFVSLADLRIRDCRDLTSGKRMRTFRMRGRYDLVIACRNIADRVVAVAVDNDTDSTESAETESTDALKPVGEMTKAELLAEAKGYAGITCEHSMNKAELSTAVQVQRNRRNLINRKFEV